MIMRHYTFNPAPQHVTEARNRKIVYVLLLIFTAIGMYMIGDRSHDTATPTPKTITTKIKSEVPRCDLEDGSTQEVCWWHDAANGRYLNINFGQYVYVPMNDEMINWSE